MIGFIIGLMIGGVFGVFIMALMNAASSEDDRTAHYSSDKEI